MTIKLSSKGAVDGSYPPFFNEPISPSDYIAGRYYEPSLNSVGVSTATMAQDVLYFTPFVPFLDHTFDRIAAYNGGTGDTGEKFRLGIYESTNGRPVDLLLDAGEITLDGSAALRAITISQALVKDNLYFLAYVGDSSTVMKAFNTDNVTPVLPRYGFDDFQVATMVAGTRRLFTQAHTYGVLPATVAATGSSAFNIAINLRG